MHLASRWLQISLDGQVSGTSRCLVENMFPLPNGKSASTYHDPLLTHIVDRVTRWSGCHSASICTDNNTREGSRTPLDLSFRHSDRTVVQQRVTVHFRIMLSCLNYTVLVFIGQQRSTVSRMGCWSVSIWIGELPWVLLGTRTTPMIK